MKIVVAFLVLISIGAASAQTKKKSAYENLVYSKPCANVNCGAQAQAQPQNAKKNNVAKKK